MLARFSLYGFLKNQRYFEAFLVLALLDKGLDFFRIGVLVSARMLAVNLFEIPSGSLADVCGRRRTLIISLAAYLAGFLVIGAADGIAALGGGMVLLGIGDSFRSGTHKAMIFAWLSAQGRAAERTRVYGYTRSWSKFGSAASVIVGAAIVLATGQYAWAFYATAVPYAAGIVNIATYPRSLDGGGGGTGLDEVLRHLGGTLRAVVTRRGLRRLIAESMGFDGVFAAVKDYLQPVLETVAIGLVLSGAAAGDLSPVQRTALLVGPVYVALYLLAGLASRRSHLVAQRFGGEDRAAAALWIAVAGVYAVIGAGAWLGATVAVIVGFVTLHAVHNLWRPILISRFDTHGDETQGASLLSVESQAQRLATMVLAPVLGLAVDRAAAGATAFWPIGAVGAAVAVVFAATALARRTSG